MLSKIKKFFKIKTKEKIIQQKTGSIDFSDTTDLVDVLSIIGRTLIGVSSIINDLNTDKKKEDEFNERNPFDYDRDEIIFANVEDGVLNRADNSLEVDNLLPFEENESKKIILHNKFIKKPLKKILTFSAIDPLATPLDTMEIDYTSFGYGIITPQEQMRGNQVRYSIKIGEYEYAFNCNGKLEWKNY